MGSRGCGSRSAEPPGDIGIDRAQRLRLGAFRPARAGAAVPRHHVEMRPRDSGRHEFLEVQRRGDRAGMRPVGDVVDVGDLAVEQSCGRAATAASATAGRPRPRRRRAGPSASASSLQNSAGSSGPSATRAAPVRVAQSTIIAGFSLRAPRPARRTGSAAPRRRCCRSRRSGPCACGSRRAAGRHCPRRRSRPPAPARAAAPAAWRAMIAWPRPSMIAAPAHVLLHQFSMPAAGLRSSPPVSKHTPLPTSVTLGASSLAPARSTSRGARRAGAADRVDGRVVLCEQIVADDDRCLRAGCLGEPPAPRPPVRPGPCRTAGVVMRSRARNIALASRSTRAASAPSGHTSRRRALAFLRDSAEAHRCRAPSPATAGSVGRRPGSGVEPVASLRQAFRPAPASVHIAAVAVADADQHRAASLAARRPAAAPILPASPAKPSASTQSRSAPRAAPRARPASACLGHGLQRAPPPASSISRRTGNRAWICSRSMPSATQSARAAPADARAVSAM